VTEHGCVYPYQILKSKQPNVCYLLQMYENCIVYHKWQFNFPRNMTNVFSYGVCSIQALDVNIGIAEAAVSCATESIHSHNTPLATLPLRPGYPPRHQTIVFTRMLMVINCATDESFQLVVIGQRVLVSNTAAGTDGRAGIDMNYAISSTSRHITFPPV